MLFRSQIGLVYLGVVEIFEHVDAGHTGQDDENGNDNEHFQQREGRTATFSQGTAIYLKDYNFTSSASLRNPSFSICGAGVKDG